jgi:hypothetical protein
MEFKANPNNSQKRQCQEYGMYLTMVTKPNEPSKPRIVSMVEHMASYIKKARST